MGGARLRRPEKGLLDLAGGGGGCLTAHAGGID